MAQFRNSGQFNQSIDPSLFIFNNDLIPTADNAYDIGSTTRDVAQIYADTLNPIQIIFQQAGANTIGLTAFLDESLTMSSKIPFILGALTTAERNGLTLAVNGMLIYNTTTNQVECYENGGWRQV